MRETVAPIEDEEELIPVEPLEGSATVTGVATGGLLGALGGLLVGIGALTLPGVGPALAAGPLAASLGGAALGAATGGLVGALSELGVPEEYASAYASDLERGHVLLAVRTDTALQAKVREIMAQSGAVNLFPAKTTLT